MNGTDEGNQIREMLRKEYNRYDTRAFEVIDPANLASRVLKAIDPESSGPALERWACMEKLKDIAREICGRRSQGEVQATLKQGILFEGLQKRYPCKREGIQVYVLRDAMTYVERKQTAAELRGEAKTKTKHADALDAETDELLRRGLLKKTA